MALIHERLYQSKDFANIDFTEYVKSLVNELFISHGVDRNKIKPKIEIEDVSLDMENAIPCGLIINEAVSNSLKYAFPEEKEGEIKISLRSFNDDQIELLIGDDGVGISKEVDIRNTETLGLHLIARLVEYQLSGEIELNRINGTEYHIKFKRQLYKKRI
jgi:two-component sensor histidine kinase